MLEDEASCLDKNILLSADFPLESEISLFCLDLDDYYLCIVRRKTNHPLAANSFPGLTPPCPL